MIVFKDKLTIEETKVVEDFFISAKNYHNIQHFNFPINDENSSVNRLFILKFDADKNLIGYGAILFSSFSLFRYYKIAKIIFGPVCLSLTIENEFANEIISELKRNKRIIKIEIQRNLIEPVEWDYLPKLKEKHKATLLIPLNSSIQEIYNNFATVLKKNLKSAKNKGIEIILLQNNDTHQVEEFVATYHAMCLSREIVLSNDNYIQSICNFIIKSERGFILVAKLDGKIVGGGIFFINSKICSYYVGAAAPEFRKIPISHAVLYDAIMRAKALNLDFFDLGGYELNTDPKQQSFHINQFKIQFSNQLYVYEKVIDLVISPFIYNSLNSISTFLRKVKKRF